jgi:hypothetical protein
MLSRPARYTSATYAPYTSTRASTASQNSWLSPCNRSNTGTPASENPKTIR